MIRRVFALTAISMIGAVLPVCAEKYEIDPIHSSAGFSVRHMMVTNVKGSFSKVSGTIEYDPKKPAESKVDATIDISSVNTNDEKRDGHLKSPDFFDAAKFPTMTFKSKKVTAEGKQHLKVLGDLTLHGVTKEVTLDVDGPTDEVKGMGGKLERGASATAKINRKDFGVSWNKNLDNGGVALGEEIPITIDIEMSAAK